MQEPDVLIPGQLRQEGDGRVEKGRGDPRQTDEFPVEIVAIGVAAECGRSLLGPGGTACGGRGRR